MTFDSREISEYGGAPVELFRFYHGADIWLFTSSAKDETYGGEIYLSVPIKMSGTQQTGESKKVPITISMQSSENLISKFRIVPPSSTTWLTIFRGHRDESTGEVDPAATAPFWLGRIRGVVFKGGEADIKCDPMDAVLDREVLRIQYQKNCNYSLYDSSCGIDRAAFAVTCVVASITDNVIALTSATFAGKPTGWFNAGEIVYNGDRREIKSHDTAGVTVMLPFEGMAVGASVTVYPGCDKSLTTCAAKYNNVLRHGGFPNIPGSNVFVTGIPPAIPGSGG